MELNIVAFLIGFAVSFVFFGIADFLKYSRVPTATGGSYWPFVGHIPQLLKGRELTALVTSAARAAGFPSVVCLKGGILDRAKYFVLDPKDIEHFLKTNFDNYVLSQGERGDVLADLLGDGIFNSDGHKWLLQRKLASREFSANRFRFFMAEVFNRAAHKLSGVLEREVAAAPVGQRAAVDLHKWFFTLTLDAFSEIAFGLDLGGLDGKPQPFIAAFDKCQEHAHARIVKYVGIWKAMRALNVGAEREMAVALKMIDDFVYGLMDQLLEGRRDLPASPTKKGGAQDAEEEDDLLRRLLPAAKRDDGSYDRKLVRDMLLNLIIAGRDTTAASMSWTMYELMRHPEHVKEILEELDSEVGPTQAPTFDNVGQCHYLQAVLSESQRLHPSIPFSLKTALKSDVLPVCGIHVQPGDTVGYSNAAMAHDPKVWGADASEFKPSRWLAADGTCRKEGQFKYPAFNAGPRLCLGMDMANLEMKVVLAILLRKFRFELVPGQTVEPANAITLQMRYGVKAYVTRA